MTVPDDHSEDSHGEIVDTRDAGGRDARQQHRGVYEEISSSGGQAFISHLPSDVPLIPRTKRAKSSGFVAAARAVS